MANYRDRETTFGGRRIVRGGTVQRDVKGGTGRVLPGEVAGDGLPLAGSGERGADRRTQDRMSALTSGPSTSALDTYQRNNADRNPLARNLSTPPPRGTVPFPRPNVLMDDGVYRGSSPSSLPPSGPKPYGPAQRAMDFLQQGSAAAMGGIQGTMLASAPRPAPLASTVAPAGTVPFPTPHRLRPEDLALGISHGLGANSGGHVLDDGRGSVPYENRAAMFTGGNIGTEAGQQAYQTPYAGPGSSGIVSVHGKVQDLPAGVTASAHERGDIPATPQLTPHGYPNQPSRVAMFTGQRPVPGPNPAPVPDPSFGTQLGTNLRDDVKGVGQAITGAGSAVGNKAAEIAGNAGDFAHAAAPDLTEGIHSVLSAISPSVLFEHMRRRLAGLPPLGQEPKPAPAPSAPPAAPAAPAATPGYAGAYLRNSNRDREFLANGR